MDISLWIAAAPMMCTLKVVEQASKRTPPRSAVVCWQNSSFFKHGFSPHTPVSQLIKMVSCKDLYTLNDLMYGYLSWINRLTSSKHLTTLIAARVPLVHGCYTKTTRLLLLLFQHLYATIWLYLPHQVQKIEFQQSLHEGSFFYLRWDRFIPVQCNEFHKIVCYVNQ